MQLLKELQPISSKESLHDVLTECPVQREDEENENDEDIKKDDRERNLRFYQSTSTSAAENEDDLVHLEFLVPVVPGGEKENNGSFVKVPSASPAAKSGGKNMHLLKELQLQPNSSIESPRTGEVDVNKEANNSFLGTSSLSATGSPESQALPPSSPLLGEEINTSASSPKYS